MELIYIGNSNNVWLRRVRNELGELVSDGSFSARLLEVAADEEGAPVLQPVLLTNGDDPGWPLPFSSLGLGDYRAHLPADLDVRVGVEYTLVVEGEADGRVFEETRKIFGRHRGR